MPYTKREFLKTLAGGAASLVGAPITALGGPTDKRLKRIGLIANTIRVELAKEVRQTLARVAALGYRELEFEGTYGHSPAEFRRLLDEVGLRAIAGGGVLGQLTGRFPQMAETAQVLGKKYLVCYWGFPDDGKNKTLDDYRRLADQLNQLGEKCQKNRLRLAYHNHDLEFRPTEGQVPYDVLLAHTDPQRVAMQLDVYWAAKAGADPVALLQKHARRVALLHLKDLDRTPERGMACVGQGQLDFRAILAEAKHTEHFVVEHDRPANPLECAAQGFAHLSKLRF
jgi:sugar phosphate isomerase/epimerase